MPIIVKPLFRADVLRQKLASFNLPAYLQSKRDVIVRWQKLIQSGNIDSFKEETILPDHINDIFHELLGYTTPVDNPTRHSLSREQHVKVGGKFADAAIGVFGSARPQFIGVLEGKGPLDPLDKPHAGRKVSAVEQAYNYAVNLKCDWIIITNCKEVRLYHKSNDHAHFERFDIALLASDEALLKKFVFLLGAERVVRGDGSSHFPELLSEAEKIGSEVTLEYYRQYADIRRQAFEKLRTANPTIPPALVLTAAQKLLDRILFCTFSENRGLLPAGIVTRAYHHADPFNPRPIWENFRGLFRSIDKGNLALKVDEYNGGLFALDTILDSQLTVPDDVCTLFTKLADYDYRDGGDGSEGKPIDVEILGHIFEQSITDLERIHDQLAGRTREDDPTQGRRKKEGAFYTPAFITRYIVAQTLKPILAERFEALQSKYRADSPAPVRKLFEGDMDELPVKLNKEQRKALEKFWDAWLDELAKIRVLDPSCGSGAFLIETFNQLHVEYDRAIAILTELRGIGSLYHPDSSILQNNLYGVDLNEEAIEICRLSLWIKTAKHGEKLTSLDHTIRIGNSVVNDPAIDPKAFDWPAAFPEVTAAGGFDVVVANPPYVRQEWISAIKPHLQQHYKAYDGVADLYVYFYELALTRLRPGGRMGFIVTNKWLKADYAEGLRRLFAETAWVESVVDFGHAKQIFPDAEVFPCILIARKPVTDPVPTEARVCAIPRELLRIDDLSRQIAEEGFPIPRIRLTPQPWSLEPPTVDALMEKIRRCGVPLKDYVGGKPLYGIKTGCNEAFLIDTPMRDALVKADPKSAEIIKPYLRGQDIDRWLPEWAGLWMIFARKGIDIEAYPAVKKHLELYREQLEPKPKGWTGGEWKGRAPGSYQWYELQASPDYWQEFEKPKIVYQEIQFHSCYALDETGKLGNNKIFFIPIADLYLLALLNSPLLWWHNWRYLPHMKDEALTPAGFMMEELPIARPSDMVRAETEKLSKRVIEITSQNRNLQRDILDWLRIEYAIEKPTQKLSNLLELNAEALIAEVKKIRGKKNPLSVAGLRQLREEHAKTLEPARALAAEALTLERRLSDLVNAAYGLTEEEVALMWKTAPPRMPFMPDSTK